MANSNIAIDTLPTLQISVGISRYLKRFIVRFRFFASFQISGRMYNCVVSIKCMMWKVFRSKQLLLSNDRNRVRWVVLGLSEDGVCTDLFKNVSVNSLKEDLSDATTFNPPLFSLVNTFNFKAWFSSFSALRKCVYFNSVPSPTTLIFIVH